MYFDHGWPCPLRCHRRTCSVVPHAIEVNFARPTDTALGKSKLVLAFNSFAIRDWVYEHLQVWSPLHLRFRFWLFYSGTANFDQSELANGACKLDTGCGFLQGGLTHVCFCQVVLRQDAMNKARLKKDLLRSALTEDQNEASRRVVGAGIEHQLRVPLPGMEQTTAGVKKTIPGWGRVVLNYNL